MRATQCPSQRALHRKPSASIALPSGVPMPVASLKVRLGPMVPASLVMLAVAVVVIYIFRLLVARGNGGLRSSWAF